MGFQLVTISGWCSLEPKVVSFERNGEQRSLVKVGVAVPVGFGDNKTVTFYDVVAFEGDSNFKFMSEYVKRGDNIVAVGDLKPPRLYQSNGEWKAALEMHVRSFDRPSKAPVEGDQQGQEQQDGGQQPAAAAVGNGQGNGGQQRGNQGGGQQQRNAAPPPQGQRGQAPPPQQRTGGNYQGTRGQSNRQAPPQGGQGRGAAPQGSRNAPQNQNDPGDGPF
jgi:hypothetical protein